MTLNEIKQALDQGKSVYWSNPAYYVHKDKLGQYLITFAPNGSTIGLTWQDGITLNGKKEDFYTVGGQK